MPLVSKPGKPVAWLHGEVKTPPFSKAARLEAGVLLRQLQHGDVIGMPHSRQVPAVGSRCHELRIPDARRTWRIVYRVDADAVIVLAVFAKKTPATPRAVLEACRRRLHDYDRIAKR